MTLTTSIKSHNVSTYTHILQYIQIIITTTCFSYCLNFWGLIINTSKMHLMADVHVQLLHDTFRELQGAI